MVLACPQQRLAAGWTPREVADVEGQKIRALVGGALILVGILFLLDSLGLFALGVVAVGVAFAAAGAAFLYVFLSRRDQWWPVIPGFALVGIGVLIILGEVAPGLEWLGGALLLGMLSLAFWVVYLTQRAMWWAIIPGGALATLAVVALLDETAGGHLGGAVFFVGLAATFAVLALLPTPEGRMRWALVPAGILAAIGVLIGVESLGVASYVWPLALIAGGAFLLWRALSRSKSREGGPA